MSLEPPPYLFSLQNNIRARPVAWDGAVRAGHITDAHLKKIKAVDKVRKEQRKQVVEGDLDGYSTLILGGSNGPGVLESAGKKDDVLQYILVLGGDLIADIPSFATSLVARPHPYKPFIQLLRPSTHPEDPIPLLTSSVLTSLLSQALASRKPDSAMEDALDELYNYLSVLSKSSDSGLQDIAVQEYSSLLRTKRSRELFWARKDETISPLIEILRSAAGTPKDADSTLWSGASSIRSAAEPGLAGGVGLQLLYRVLLVLWQLSFEGGLIGDGLQDEHDIIQLYCQLLRVSPKEKTTRLLLSTLNNLLSANQSTLLPAAVLARLPALLQNLQGRHLTDPDLLEDMKTINEMLDDYQQTRTTFDEYAAEVRSGHLRWSPPHRKDTFWRENARRILEADKGELPKELAEIMAKPWENDKQVLAIACNDVGCLVKEVPEKRTQLERLGLKGRVMELMADRDESVRYEALKAVGEWLRYSFEG